MGTIVASGHIYQYLSKKIVRVDGDHDNEAEPKDGTRLILESRVSDNIDEREFYFEPQEGYEPYGFIRHAKSGQLVYANGNELKVHTEKSDIRINALFAFDLKDNAIIHRATQKCWDSNDNGKLKLGKKDEVKTNYYFGDKEGAPISPYPVDRQWKLLKAIVAPSHSGSISVKYTVGLTQQKSQQVTGTVSGNLELAAAKIAKISFGTSLSIMHSESTGTSKLHEATISVNFPQNTVTVTTGAMTSQPPLSPSPPPSPPAPPPPPPPPITCIWQYYSHIPSLGFELGFLSDIIVVTNDYKSPPSTLISDDNIMSLLGCHI